MRSIVVGLGNPLLRDDGVGPLVIRALSSLRQDACLLECGVGGLSLMEAVAGFDRAFIVDATWTGTVAPGTIRTLRLADLGTSRNLACMHDTSLPTALELAQALNMKLPGDIRIWGIEGRTVDTFGTSLTDEVARAVPHVVDQIRAALEESI